MGVKILSLYDGMACGMIAMQLAGVEVESYDAYEIDKYAIKTAQHNFPMIKEYGDVFDADFTQYEGVDFLIGGSPCTYWSIAQTKNRETVASGMGWELFSQYVRALHEAKPKYFIYENNKSMSKAIRASIDEAFGFEAVLINSALVSAQNRQRLYWVGKRNADGTYSRVNVEQPADRGVLLKDVLDSAVARDLTCNDKSYTLTASYDGACAWNTIERHQKNMVAEPVACRCRGRVDASGNGYAKYECREDGKSNTLDTNTTNGAMVAEPVNTDANGKAFCVTSRYYKGFGNNPGKCLEKHRDSMAAEPLVTTKNGKSFAITANYVHIQDYPNDYAAHTIEKSVKPLVAEPINMTADGKAQCLRATCYKDGKEITIYEVKDGKITIKGKQYPIKLRDGYYIIRKLTVSECKRLQTVPEWYEFPVSNSQAYKMLGNGWTCEVIAHLIRSCMAEQWGGVDG